MDRVRRSSTWFLFAVALAPGVRAQSYKLSAPFTGAIEVLGDVTDASLSPDGTRVVYRADQERDETFELHSAPIDGRARPVELSGPLPPRGAVRAFQIGPDGARVVYVADQDDLFVPELYSVPIDGSASPVKLNGPLVPGGAIVAFQSSPAFAISADGRRVVYAAEQDTDGVIELYSVPIDGSARPVKLNGPLSPGRGV